MEAKFSFFGEKLSTSTTTDNVEPGLYTSITDFAQAMNTLIQEKNNHNGACITVKVSRRTKKVVNMLANDTSGLAFCSTEFGHFFGNNVGNDNEGYDCYNNAEQSYPLLHILSNNTKFVNYNRRHLFTQFLPSSFTKFFYESK